MTKEELQKNIAIDEGFRIELTKSKGEVETIQKGPDTMQKTMQKDPKTIQKAMQISRLQELELLNRKGGKKNGEWIVAIVLDLSNDIE
jgi:hypothetical protein